MMYDKEINESHNGAQQRSRGKVVTNIEGIQRMVSQEWTKMYCTKYCIWYHLLIGIT